MIRKIYQGTAAWKEIFLVSRAALTNHVSGYNLNGQRQRTMVDFLTTLCSD